MPLLLQIEHTHTQCCANVRHTLMLCQRKTHTHSCCANVGHTHSCCANVRRTHSCCANVRHTHSCCANVRHTHSCCANAHTLVLCQRRVSFGSTSVTWDANVHCGVSCLYAMCYLHTYLHCSGTLHARLRGSTCEPLV